MNVAVKSIQKILLTMLLALAIGALFILFIGENPLEAYGALLRGAFNGRLKIGTTLASFTPLLLTSCAFAVAAKAGAFNVGVEGEVFLGGITAAYIGINWTFLPAPVLLIVCFLGAMAVAALWALIPAVLKAYYRVSEVCVTILMNSVALYITSYLVSGPMSAGVANAQSLPVTVNLPQFMKPSSVNAGLFIALITVVLMIWVLNKTTFGYKVKTVGTNPSHAEYVGISPKKIFIQSMMLSGALGGMAGCIEVLGVHGYFLNNFAAGLGSNGMLASLIVKNNLAFAPFMSFFLAVLKSGAMGMQQSTGVPKSIVDTITAVFIIVATMELLFQFKNKKTKKEKSK
jgi:simple sugar transport system permease protein